MKFRIFLICFLPVASFAAAVTDTGEARPVLFAGLRWHEIGPYRGGRTTAVVGVEARIYRFYFGATGGGLWRSDNAGGTWRQLGLDEFGSGSVGAIAVSAVDPETMYVGLGESPYRLYTSTYGDGVYRSDDGGLTWRHLGLSEVRQIGEILIDPNNSDVLLVAAQGSPWGPDKDRGVYRSIDGGKNWNHVLYIDSSTGAVDLTRDAEDDQIIYVSVWDHDYDPWYLGSGGTGSGLFRSNDGGVNWQRAEIGLPAEDMGKVGVSASPRIAGRVWALVESDSKNAGVYLSEDAGNSWKLINGNGNIRTRPWYYTHIIADPANPEKVYSLGQDAYVSNDRGKTFEEILLAGYDFHDIWISSTNPDVMIVGSDGGATITVDGMKTWSTVHNQPTSQLYRVSVDRQVPYRIYSAQQDNTTLSISSRPNWGGLDAVHYIDVGGGETGYVEPDPFDPMIIYATNELGLMTRYDRRNNSSVQIHAHLSFSEGVEPRRLKYRFAVNSPIVASKHNKCVLYHGAQVLLRSKNCGDTWVAISPDLTYDIERRQGKGGGPYTNEIINHFGAIASIAESSLDPSVIWTGANDGAVGSTSNGGGSWHRANKSSFAPGSANTVEASPHDLNKAYVAVFSMPWNDYRPYLYRTNDFGRSWELISLGLPSTGPVRVVREDPEVPGLLYAGTETGIHFSPDDGQQWSSLALNLPTVAVTDIKITDTDLVISTQGRGIWILPNIHPVRRLARDGALTFGIRSNGTAHAVLTTDYEQQQPWTDTGFSPRFNPYNFGDTLPTGAVLDFYLPDTYEPGDAVLIDIMSKDGEVVRSLSSHDGDSPSLLTPHAGHNRFVWDLRANPLPSIPRVWDSRRIRPKALVGKYKVSISWQELHYTSAFEVLPDPRFPGGPDDLAYKDELKDRMVRLILELIQTGQQVEALRECVLSGDCEPNSLIERIDAWQNANADPRLTINNDRVNFGASFIYDATEFLNAIESASAPLTPTYQKRYQELENRWMTEKRQAQLFLDSALEVP